VIRKQHLAGFTAIIPIMASENSSYYDNYFGTLTSSGLMGFFHKLMHRSIERGIKKSDFFDRILELGAGENRHFDSVIHKFNEYHLIDIRYSLLFKSIIEKPDLFRLIESNETKAEFQKIVQSNHDESLEGNARLYCSEGNAEKLEEFPIDFFDRVFSTCLIMHLEHPEQSLKESRRVLKDNGRLDIYVHSEPGFLLRIARYISLKGHVKRMGYDHLKFVYTEHRYSFLFLKYLIEDVFSEDEIVWRSHPFPCLSWNLSFWKVATINITKSNYR
jgi:SAM-dependent methyltransferase